ncbi:MAG: helix-turn-helix domain-containing protein [Candidatus Thermoplasmatota archaeon]|uniref:helix-turn-helix domain-containing protein n=1 Tax=Ferroplasma sp. TaxID=2591003 RepID=UPI0017A67B70|nr:helix-turn-helix domain-containing protein [Ferroplasma sp.]MCL4311452.1 helix-turn-helix domain-containing protein [Candidatus Thermoplasmatota archaeon]HIH60111.1 transposase [Ferroplasma sp.]HII82643.1 transposase [Ferroplasma sp.]
MTELRIHIKSVSEADITKRIREERNGVRVITRLIFIKFLYTGMGVIEASKNVGVAKRVGYQWIKRWNESSYDGLTPIFAGGKLGKLSMEQKDELKALLQAKDLWYLKDIVDLITTKFSVEYSERQIRRILKSFKMTHTKPYRVYYNKPDDADKKLKKLDNVNPSESIIGFFDEATPQTSSNTVRMWSFGKPTIRKNTTKFRANTFRF